MTVKRTWVVENKWICSSCKTENLGRFMECQSCRSPKEKDEADILSGPDAPEVKDAELLRLAKQGANWVCEYCGGQVRDEHGKCVKNCGAPRPEARVEVADGKVKIQNTSGVRVQVPPQPRPAPTGVPGPGVPRPKMTKEKSRLPMILVGVLGVGAFIALLVILLVPREVDAKVNSIKWQYTSDLRQKTLMHGEGWGSPSGSFNVACTSKYYGDEDCHPHDCNPHSQSYECNCTYVECNCRQSCTSNGNGFSTCEETCSQCRSCSTCSKTVYDTCYDSCPVYKDYCTYDYYEWPIITTLKTSGIQHDEHWPDLAANGPDQKLERTEAYEVTFIEEKEAKDNWKYRAKSLDDFKKFETNKAWHIEVNRLGYVTPLHPNP